MAHRNPNKNERAAARDYAAQHGLSYQQALERIRSGGSVPLFRVEDLREIVAAQVARHGVAMDEFTPYELVEGDVEEAVLSAFRLNGPIEVGAAELISAPADPPRYSVELRVHGEGDVDWNVSAPSGGDLAAFASVVENAEHGGGFFQSWDSAVGVTLELTAEYRADARTWSDVTVEYASVLASEAERRARHHEEAERRRLQALGLEPSDGEIDALLDELGGTR